MKEPVLLLQSGDYMRTEKIACCFSSYPVLNYPFEKIRTIDRKNRLQYVPVGTVEFVREWCDWMELSLPGCISYEDSLSNLYDRNIRKGQFSEALPYEFVKPCSVKRFTGAIKNTIHQPIEPSEPVWISDPVPFESEFRFYIHDFVTGPKIYGWARYDDLEYNNPEPDLNLVEKVSDSLHTSLGPSAYSIDIGWRPDLGKYSLVEINDAWSLGLYENTDPQSNPPTRQQYADMLVSRWYQILFCNVV